MIRGVIFDLDGVLVSTDEFHFLAWQKLCQIEGVYFDRMINERLRGVSRIESLQIILEQSTRKYTKVEVQEMSNLKNDYYRSMIEGLTCDNLLPGALMALKFFKNMGYKIGLASSSKNAFSIISKTGIMDYFDTVVDGNQITRSKPDPEVFLLASQKINIPPNSCLAIEDAESGVEAALQSGMKVIVIGKLTHQKAHFAALNLESVNLQRIIKILNNMSVRDTL